jgi:hypothetical protein
MAILNQIIDSLDRYFLHQDIAVFVKEAWILLLLQDDQRFLSMSLAK